MAKYLLKVSGSNEIVNIIENDISSSFEVPNGYFLELATSESRITNEISSSQLELNNYYVGNFYGDANLNTLSINGKDFEDIISNQNFGYFYYTQSINFSNNVNPGNGYFKFNQSQSLVWGIDENLNETYTPPTKLAISLQQRNGDILYSSNFAESKFKNAILEINDDNLQNSFIIFKDRNNSIVKKLEIVSSSVYTENSNSYAILDVNEKYNFFDKSFYTTNEIFTSTTSSLSGSVTISSEILIPNGTIFDIELVKETNKNEETALQASIHTSYGKLKWDANSYDVVDECTPKQYFRFDREFTQGLISDWNTKNPQKISLSLSNIYEYVADIVAYRESIINVIQNRLKNTNITLKNVLVPDSYKTFRIVSGKIYSKKFRENTSPLYFKLDWGGSWEIIQGEITPDARFDELPSLDPNGPEPWYEYVELDVVEVDTQTGLTSAPLHDQEFNIGFEFNVPETRTERYEFTSSVNFTVPKWAKKTTVVCVGAGGGGGAGSYAWQWFDTYSDGGEVNTHYFIYDKNNQMRKITSPCAVGGGGGAGGDVCFKTFNSYELPPLTECTVIVGAGGSGGGWPFKYNEVAQYEKGPWHENKYCGENDWDPGSCMWGYPANSGNKGGDSVFYKKASPTPNDKPDLWAGGGAPGKGGLGIRSDQNERFEIPLPTLKSGGYRWNVKSLKNATGLDNVGSYIVGGPGGFGITVVDPNKETIYSKMVSEAVSPSFMYPYGNKFKNINNAPSLPMSSSTHFNQYGFEDAARLIKSLNVSNEDNPDVLMPYGYRNRKSNYRNNNLVIEEGMNDVASFNAPTGGGGGTGDVTDSFAKFFFISQSLGNTWQNFKLPSNSFRIYVNDSSFAEMDANYVNLWQKQKIGKGGKRLIKKDFYGIQFGEGGDGGNLVTIGGLPEVTASNGGFPGGGGGGGASIVLSNSSAVTPYGATDHHSNTFSYTSPLLPINEGGDNYILKKESPLRGGDGANGLVVIIVEG